MALILPDSVYMKAVPVFVYQPSYAYVLNIAVLTSHYGSLSHFGIDHRQYQMPKLCQRAEGLSPQILRQFLIGEGESEGLTAVMNNYAGKCPNSSV